jgi:hypothetical protein
LLHLTGCVLPVQGFASWLYRSISRLMWRAASMEHRRKQWPYYWQKAVMFCFGASYAS